MDYKPIIIFIDRSEIYLIKTIVGNRALYLDNKDFEYIMRMDGPMGIRVVENENYPNNFIQTINILVNESADLDSCKDLRYILIDKDSAVNLTEAFDSLDIFYVFYNSNGIISLAGNGNRCEFYISMCIEDLINFMSIDYFFLSLNNLIKYRIHEKIKTCVIHPEFMEDLLSKYNIMAFENKG